MLTEEQQKFQDRMAEILGSEDYRELSCEESIKLLRPCFGDNNDADRGAAT